MLPKFPMCMMSCKFLFVFLLNHMIDFVIVQTHMHLLLRRRSIIPIDYYFGMFVNVRRSFHMPRFLFVLQRKHLHPGKLPMRPMRMMNCKSLFVFLLNHMIDFLPVQASKYLDSGKYSKENYLHRFDCRNCRSLL